MSTAALASLSSSPSSSPVGAQLVGQYRGGIYTFLRRKGFGADEADDLTQETLLRACTHLGSFRGASIGSWIYRIAANLAVDHIRRQRTTLLPMDDLIQLAGEVPGPLERVARDERHAEIHEMLEQLPAKHRQMIWLRYFEERSLDEIARATECTPSIAKQRVFRALSALRRQCHMQERRAERALA